MKDSEPTSNKYNNSRSNSKNANLNNTSPSKSFAFESVDLDDNRNTNNRAGAPQGNHTLITVSSEEERSSHRLDTEDNIDRREKSMQIFESAEQKAQRLGYQDFDYMETSESKSEAGASSQVQDTTANE